jgi:hypothetical protein
MSKYDWAELMRKWTLEEMTAEQAIGQLLLWTQETVNKVQRLQSSLSSLKREKAALVTQVERLEAQLRSSVDEQLELDALKREQAQLKGRVDRLAQRVEGLVMREIRRHGG